MRTDAPMAGRVGIHRCRQEAVERRHECTDNTSTRGRKRKRNVRAYLLCRVRERFDVLAFALFLATLAMLFVVHAPVIHFLMIHLLVIHSAVHGMFEAGRTGA